MSISEKDGKGKKPDAKHQDKKDRRAAQGRKTEAEQEQAMKDEHGPQIPVELAGGEPGGEPVRTPVEEPGTDGPTPIGTAPSAKKAEPAAKASGEPEKEKKAPRPAYVEKPMGPSVVVKLDRKLFQEALGIAKGFCEKTNTMPALKTVRIKAADKEAEIYATDLSIYWQRPMLCDAAAPVDLCVDAKLLFDEVKALPAEIANVELKVAEGEVSVNGRVRLHSLKSEEYPAFPAVEGEPFTIDGLSGKFGKVVPAVGDEDKRFTLNFIYLDRAGGSIVGTDGHRMHLENIPAVEGAASILIPRKFAEQHSRHQGGPALTADKDYVAANLMGGRMLARIGEGAFPDYAKFFPKDFKAVVRVSSRELIEVLDGAVPLSKSVKLTANGTLEVMSLNVDSGIYKWEIPCATELLDKDTQIPITFGINAAYLIDAVEAFAPERVELGFTGTNTPALINGQAVVMPMKV